METPANNSSSEDEVEVDRNEAPAVVNSTVHRHGRVTGTPDSVMVKVTYLRERDDVQVESTPRFDVNKNGVAALVDSDGGGTIAEKFIPITIAAEKVREMPEINNVEGVPSFDFMTKSIGDAIGSTAPQITEGTQGTDSTQKENQTTARENARSGQQESSGTERDDVDVDISPEDIEEVNLSDDDRDAARNENDNVETSVSGANTAPANGQNNSSESHGAGQPNDPDPPEQAGERNVGNRILDDVEGDWFVEAIPKDNVVSQIANANTNDYITIWDMSDRNQTQFTVVYYGDGSVNEVVSSLDGAMEKVVSWTFDPPENVARPLQS